jgi:hypothetical protein
MRREVLFAPTPGWIALRRDSPRHGMDSARLESCPCSRSMYYRLRGNKVAASTDLPNVDVERFFDIGFLILSAIEASPRSYLHSKRLDP